MGALRKPSGDRPSLPHKPIRPHRERQQRLKLYKQPAPPREPKYKDASEWPAWTDEKVMTAYVPPAEWPNAVARVRFEVRLTLDDWPTTTQYALDGPADPATEQGEVS